MLNESNISVFNCPKPSDLGGESNCIVVVNNSLESTLEENALRSPILRCRSTSFCPVANTLAADQLNLGTDPELFSVDGIKRIMASCPGNDE